MRILITGGTGFIGQALITHLLPEHEIWCYTRSADRVKALFDEEVTAVEHYDQLDGIAIEAVINLAGAGIADRRWSEQRKALLRSSRIDTTAELVAWISRQSVPPEVLISGSAIGYYGDQPTGEPLTETADVHAGFTHQLCADWEAQALAAEQYGVRVCLIRTGVVLGQGGALARMLPPFRLGLGGPIASGEQWMSWIHLHDQVAAISWLLEHHHLSGAFNLTAPEGVNNREFSQVLARVLHRPAFFTVPAVMIKLMLGEGAELLLGGQRVVPQCLQQSGFQFSYPRLEEALSSLV
ncbi:MAG: TIGR01777 family oxidoreductase [Marinobacterium sp.]|nr:TIGR01777 family oxidoreductase [Marinobacterium sp.]